MPSPSPEAGVSEVALPRPPPTRGTGRRRTRVRAGRRRVTATCRWPSGSAARCRCSSSKNLALTASQPPRSSSMVNSPDGVGNGLAGSLAPSTCADGDAVDHRAEALLGELLLPGRAEHEVEVGLRLRVRRPSAPPPGSRSAVCCPARRSRTSRPTAEPGSPRSRRRSAHPRCPGGRHWSHRGRCPEARRRCRRSRSGTPWRRPRCRRPPRPGGRPPGCSTEPNPRTPGSA